MRKLMAGAMLVMVGVGIGMGVDAGSGGAGVRAYEAVTKIADQDETYQLGYVAGIHDALQAIAGEPAPTGQSDHYMAMNHLSAMCMIGKGQTLGELLAWAKYRWMVDSHRYPDDTAAGVLIAGACK
jgi:hypothetical protein